MLLCNLVEWVFGSAGSDRLALPRCLKNMATLRWGSWNLLAAVLSGTTRLHFVWSFLFSTHSCTKLGLRPKLILGWKLPYAVGLVGTGARISVLSTEDARAYVVTEPRMYKVASKSLVEALFYL